MVHQGGGGLGDNEGKWGERCSNSGRGGVGCTGPIWPERCAGVRIEG